LLKKEFQAASAICFDNDTMGKLAESGCWKIALGVESGDDGMLEQIKKKVTTDDVRAAVDKLAAYDIQAKGFFSSPGRGFKRTQTYENIY
jgi:radical SAM superfamily enzyme YgiQ (UPF0313 family)